MSEERREDILLGNRLRIYQPEYGYRFSIDSLLLADFISINEYDEVIELGSGCGVILLILAKRFPSARFVGIEIQEELYKLSLMNKELNEIGEGLEFIMGDLKEIDKYFDKNSFDLCISNPPYRQTNIGRIPPEKGRAIARFEMEMNLSDLVEAAKYLLKEGGHLMLIYDNSRKDEIISTLEKNFFSIYRIRYIHPFHEEDPNSVLIDAVYNKDLSYRLLPPLIIWDSVRKYTDEVQDIIDGVW